MLRFDEHTGKYFEVDNVTGKMSQVDSTGYKKRKYDLKLSGVGNPTERKEKAKRDNIFDLGMKIDMQNLNVNLYNPTPNKLLGTTQFPRPKAKLSKSGKSEANYPVYFSQPQWHSKIIGLMESEDSAGKTKPETLKIYKDLFQGLNPISSGAKKALLKAEETIKKKKKSRKLAPISIEYVHLQKYRDQLHDPQQKVAFFKTEADINEDMLRNSEIFKSEALKQSKDATDFNGTYLSKTFGSYQEFIDAGESTKLKTIKDYDEELKVKLSHKEFTV